MNEQHVGSDFDHFLEEEGIRQAVEQAAIKRVLMLRIQELTSKPGISEAELRAAAERMAQTYAADKNLTALTDLDQEDFV